MEKLHGNILSNINKLVESKSKSRGIPNQKFVEKILDVFEMMSGIDSTDKEVDKCISHMLNIDLPYYEDISDPRIERLFEWLHAVYLRNAEAEYNALIAITKLVRSFPTYGIMVSNKIFYPKDNDKILMKYDNYALAVLQCIDSVFRCFENTTLSDQQMETCKAVSDFLIRMQFSSKFTPENTRNFSNITLHSIILLHKLMALCPEHMKLYVAELMGISKVFMFYGNVIAAGKEVIPQKIKPSPWIYDSTEDVDTLETNTQYRCIGGKVSKQRKFRGTRTKSNVNCILEISCENNDCEEVNNVSITEDRNYAHDQNQFEINAKIRIASISLFGEVTKILERRVLYSFWQSIFPCDTQGTEKGCRDDLLYVSQTDSNPKCRYTSLHIATEILLISKAFLNQAEYSCRTSAFLPFSQSLGLTILWVYESLTRIINTECSLSVLVQALKCVAALVQVTPFSRFQCDFIVSFLNSVKKFVFHHDFTVQISALTVLECLLMMPELPIEAIGVIGLVNENLSTINTSLEKEADEYINNVKDCGTVPNSNESKLEANETDETIFRPSWLILKTMRNICFNCSPGNPRYSKMRTPNSLRIKSLQLLSAMSNHFKLFFKGRLEEVASVLKEALNDDQLEIRLCASKCLDMYAYQLGTFLSSNNTTNNIDNCNRFWIYMLPVIIHQIQTEIESSSLKIALCDALSNIGVIVFENLPNSSRITLLSFLTGVSSESTEEVIVRAAAVRALSVFVIFHSMRNNLVFIENTAELILRLVEDENIMVRIKIFWSMGNVSDALVDNSIETSNERISDEILMRLIEHSTEACNDNDKVRCNAVRSLGNLMRLLSEKHFSNNCQRVMIQYAINKLIDCICSAGNAKVKWNTCYAVGNLLQNDNIFLMTTIYEDFKWPPTLYAALCHVICSHSNFKVRINATSALLHVNQRRYYGKHYELIWSTLMNAFEQSYNLNNFYEYNHRDQFQEQLCLLTCHIIKLAKVDDFPMVCRYMVKRQELIKNTWIRVMSRMIPERAAPLLACSVVLKELLKTNSEMHSDQKKAIQLIIEAIPSCY